MRTIVTIAIIAVVAILSFVAKLIVRENLAGIDEGHMWPPDAPAQVHPHAEAEWWMYPWLSTEGL